MLYIMSCSNANITILDKKLIPCSSYKSYRRVDIVLKSSTRAGFTFWITFLITVKVQYFQYSALMMHVSNQKKKKSLSTLYHQNTIKTPSFMVGNSTYNSLDYVQAYIEAVFP